MNEQFKHSNTIKQIEHIIGDTISSVQEREIDAILRYKEDRLVEKLQEEWRDSNPVSYSTFLAETGIVVNELMTIRKELTMLNIARKQETERVKQFREWVKENLQDGYSWFECDEDPKGEILAEIKNRWPELGEEV